MIGFKDFLVELFDKPWHLSDAEENDQADAKEAVHTLHPGSSRVKLYKAHDEKGEQQGHVLEFAHNGAMEVHHLDNDLESGFMKDSKKPNPRFISTMLDRINHHVNEKSRKVRVVGKAGMIDHYEKIGKKIVSKNKNMEMSSLEDYKHPQFDDAKSFVIKPKDKFGINEMRK